MTHHSLLSQSSKWILRSCFTFDLFLTWYLHQLALPFLLNLTLSGLKSGLTGVIPDPYSWSCSSSLLLHRPHMLLSSPLCSLKSYYVLKKTAQYHLSCVLTVLATPIISSPEFIIWTYSYHSVLNSCLALLAMSSCLIWLACESGSSQVNCSVCSAVAGQSQKCQLHEARESICLAYSVAFNT